MIDTTLRQRKIAELIRRTISNALLLSNVNFSFDSSLIVCTKVEIDQKLTNAKVFLSNIIPTIKLEIQEKDLFLLKQGLAKNLRMKKIPQINFVIV